MRNLTYTKTKREKDMLAVNGDKMREKVDIGDVKKTAAIQPRPS